MLADVRLTARQLNRTTLERQLLLRRERVEVVDAVFRVVALQAQSPASPYLALWSRVQGFDPADLDAAFAEATVVKASLLRITLHAVTSADYPWVRAAMQSRLRDARMQDAQQAVVPPQTLDPNELLAAVEEFTTTPRTAAEIRRWLEELTGSADRRLWRAVQTCAALRHLASADPWSFGIFSRFVTTTSATGAGPPVPPREATARLLLRYLQGFGPASLRDCGQFTLLRQPVLRTALADLGELVVEHAGPAGERLFDVADGGIADPDTDAPCRLLGMWDNLLLAYADRARVIPAEFRPAVIRRNGDVLPTLLVDGRVAGVWRAVPGGIEATAFVRLGRSAWAGLDAEATALRALLADRDPEVYRRYSHWWDKGMPAAERRVLGQ